MSTRKNFFEIYRHSGTRHQKVRQRCDRAIYAEQKFSALLAVSLPNTGHFPWGYLWFLSTSWWGTLVLSVSFSVERYFEKGVSFQDTKKE